MEGESPGRMQGSEPFEEETSEQPREHAHGRKKPGLHAIQREP